MATAATSLLGLALPVTGELSGTWGDTVNVSITALLDTAVAGTTTLSSDADVTLTTTTLAANQARQAIILWTAGGTVTRTITVPAQSKSYIVINKTSSSQSIKIVGVGPTTGVTIVAGTAAFVVWNGVDFVTVSVTSTTGILPVANGGTGLSSGTSGGVLAYTATGTLASSTALAASALVIGGGAGAAPSTTTTGTGVVTALGVNVGTAGAFVVNGGALGTPSSGTVTNLTGTASININGTVGATTATTGAFTTLTTSSTVTHNGGTANGVAFLNASKVLTTGSALTFDGTTATTPRLAFGGTTLPSAGTATIFGRSSDNNLYLQSGSGNDINFIDGSQNTMLSLAPATVSFNISNVNKLTLNSTGLAVTGTLSATSNAGIGTTAGGGTRLTVAATSGSLATFTQTGATGYGVTIIPGADTVYDAFTINNAANTLNKIRMFGDGSATFAGLVTAQASLAVTGTLSATGITTLSAATTPLLLSGAGSSSTTLAGNYAIRINAGSTAANYGGIFFDGSTVYDSFFGRVPTALSGINDGVGYVTYASGAPTLRTLFSSTGLAVTGTLSADKGSAGTVATFKGGTKTAYIYSDNSYLALTDAASAGGTGILINASTPTVYQQISGSLVTATTSTGLEVTGTLSATGSIQGQASAAFKTNSSSGQYYHFDNAAGNNFMGLSAANVVDLYAGGALSATFRSTGLAVTGTLSATGTLSGGTSGTAYSFSGSAPATSLTLNASGNLGLGVTPSAWVDYKVIQLGGGAIASYTGNAFFELMQNTFWDGANKYVNNGFASSYQQTSGQHRWNTAASGTAGNAISFTQAMTLDASGRLLLGTTSSPSQQAVIYRTDSSTANGALRLDGNGNYAGIQFAQSGNLRGSLSTDGANLIMTHESNILFYTGASGNVGGTERARFNSTGALVFAGGTTTADGIGITFPATQSASSNANTLDDYEEGTWTPVVIGTISSGTGTYSTQIGSYTKVGRLVTVVCGLAWSAHTGTGNIQITGLPFVNSADISVGSVFASNMNFGTLSTQLAAFVLGSDNIISFRGMINNAARADTTLDSSVDSLYITLSYERT